MKRRFWIKCGGFGRKSWKEFTMKDDFPADILIQNVSLLPFPSSSYLIPHVWLTTKNSRINALGSGDSPLISAVRIIDGAGCLAMAGLVNAHVHTPMTLFRGLADALPLK